MFDVVDVIKKLRNEEKISGEAKVLYCTDNLGLSGYMFGAIGAAISQTKLTRYVASFTNEKITFFTVNRDAVHTGQVNEIEFDNLKNATIGKTIGYSLVTLELKSNHKIEFLIYKKARKLPEQKDNYKYIIAYLKDKFPKKKK